MKTATAASCLVVTALVLANPGAVEESLRSIPPGSTDLVPRAVATPEVKVEYGPFIEVLGEWKWTFQPESDAETKELFSSRECIQFPLLLLREETEK